MVTFGVVKHGVTGSGGELSVDGEVDTSVEIVGSRREGSLSIGLAVEVLTLDSRHITSVAWDSVLGLFVSSNLVRSLHSSLVAGVAGNLALFRFKHRY